MTGPPPQWEYIVVSLSFSQTNKKKIKIITFGLPFCFHLRVICREGTHVRIVREANSHSFFLIFCPRKM